MHSFYRGLGRFSVRFRWLIIVVWVLGSFTLVRSLPSLSSQVNDQNTAFLPTSAPDARAAEMAAPVLGKEGAEPVLIVAVTRHGTLTAADLAAVQREATLAAGLHGISHVEPAGESATHRALLVSADSSTAGFDPAQAKRIVGSVVASFARARAPTGLRFYVSGQVADGVYQNAKSKMAGNATEYASILFIIILLLLIFRSVLAPIATLLPAALVLVVSGAIVGEIASHGILKVSDVTQLLLIVLVLGAGTDYGLFLVFRVREEIRNGLEPKAAVSRAVERVGESITASAGTVVVALLSLLLASFGIYHDLGVPLAIGILTMLLAGLTLLPALLAVLGRALFWPSLPRAGTNKTGWWGRIAGRIVSHPAPTLAVGLVAFGALAGAVSWYSPSGFAGAIAAPKGTPAARGDAIVRRYFAQSNSNPTNLVVKLRRSAYADPVQLEDVASRLRRSGLFTTMDSALDPAGAPMSTAELSRLHRELGPPERLAVTPPAGVTVPLQLYEQYRADAQYVSASGTIVQFAAGLKAGNPGSTAALDDVAAIRAALARAATSVHARDWGVAGEAAALADISSISDADLRLVVPIAALLIALLLALVLRSLVAPLYLIASVVLSYLAAFGLAVIVFAEIAGYHGLVFILPFLMFIFLLALGEDYNILVMTRIREEAHDHSLKEAVIRAVGASGPTITSAGLVLAGTFAVLAVAGSSGPDGGQIREIGVGLAVGILMDTFLVRTLLVPSTVALLGQWNWWPRRVEPGMGYPGTDEHHRWRLHREHAKAGAAGSLGAGSLGSGSADSGSADAGSADAGSAGAEAGGGSSAPAPTLSSVSRDSRR